MRRGVHITALSAFLSIGLGKTCSHQEDIDKRKTNKLTQDFPGKDSEKIIDLCKGSEDDRYPFFQNRLSKSLPEVERSTTVGPSCPSSRSLRCKVKSSEAAMKLRKRTNETTKLDSQTITAASKKKSRKYIKVSSDSETQKEKFQTSASISTSTSTSTSTSVANVLKRRKRFNEVASDSESESATQPFA